MKKAESRGEISGFLRCWKLFLFRRISGRKQLPENEFIFFAYNLLG